MKELACNGPKRGADQVSLAFRSRVIGRSLECLAEPTFTQMKELPQAAAFISRLKSPILRQVQRTYGDIANDKLRMDELMDIPVAMRRPQPEDKVVGQKILLILNENCKPLGVVRWIRGQGDPFFYDLLSKPESVESVLAQVPRPTVSEAPAQQAAPAQQNPEYRVCVSKTRNGDVFRVRKDGSSVEQLSDMLAKVAGLEDDAWTFRNRFSALKDLSEARDFIAKFKHTELRYELAGTVSGSGAIPFHGWLKEAAIYVITGCNRPVAAMRYVSGEGRMFFQNFLNDAPQRVENVLAAIEAKIATAQAQK